MFDSKINFLEQMMDVSAIKRKTIADNIANYNTPGFKASKISFDHMFEQFNQKNPVRLKTSNEKHIVDGTNKNDIIIEKDVIAQERTDGNNVDLNKEMIDMIKNNYLFNVAVQATNKEFALHKLAIGQ